MDSLPHAKRPWLEVTLVERWPKPDGVSHRQWHDWDAAERSTWLIDHTYEQIGDGWVLRKDNADSATSQRVEQAVTTIEGAGQLVWDLMPPTENVREKYPSLRAGVIFMLIAMVVGAIVTAALLADWGDDGSNSGDEATVGASVTLSSEPEATTSPTSLAVDASIPFSSIPDHTAYAKTWSDGSFGLSLNLDGTYRLVTSGVDETGRFKMTRDDGVDRILFLDPNDPTGIYFTAQTVASIEDGVLVFGEGSTARRLEQVDALPTVASNFPPAQELDVADAIVAGSWISDHPGIQWPTSGSEGVSYLVNAATATGGFDIDLDAATISGSIAAPFVCDVPRCAPTGADVVNGSAAYTIEAGEVSGSSGQWRFDGTATVAATFDASTQCTTGTCPWSYSLTFETPYKLRLVESEGLAYLDFDQFEGTTPDGFTYTLYLRTKIPFVGP